MKSFDQIIHERRSVRAYGSRPVEREKLTAVLEAARLAPSACNAQPWRFVVAHTPSARDAMLNAGLGTIVPNKWARTAPVVIAVCAERSFMTHAVGERAQGTAFHLLDIGMAMEHLVLKAAELGLGTCYIGWFNEKPIKKQFDLPAGWKIVCLITLGYPAVMPDPAPRKPLGDIAFMK